MIRVKHIAPTYSGGSFKPPTDAAYDLGTTDVTWRNIYTCDDGGHYFGSNQDVVIRHRTATLNANTALSGALVGTPVTPALAANSVIISNITASGDVLMAGNNGGNSRAFLFFDASTPDLLLYYVGGQWSAGATEWVVPAHTLSGAISANSKNITGIGKITITGDEGEQLALTRTNTGDTGCVIIARHDSSSPAASDIVMRFYGLGRGADTSYHNYGRFEMQIADPTDTTESGKMVWYVLKNDTETLMMTLTSTSLTFAAGTILASGATNGNTLLLNANDTTFITFTTGATDVCTIANATMSGTWLASGTVTMPAVTLGGTITCNGQNFDAAASAFKIIGTGGELIAPTRTDDGTTGVVFACRHASASPTAGDVVVRIIGIGKDSADAYNNYGQFDIAIEDPTNTTECGKMVWNILRNGSSVTAMTLSSLGMLNVIGAYQVDGVQVVGNRVIDQRIDDDIESAAVSLYPVLCGIVDALRDASITHGLIAAA